jgi:hypothetical protein
VKKWQEEENKYQVWLSAICYFISKEKEVDAERVAETPPAALQPAIIIMLHALVGKNSSCWLATTWLLYEE